MTPDQLTDYRDRLERAAKDLRLMADMRYDRHLPLDAARLSGKAEGVRLALSYLDEYAGDAPLTPGGARAEGCAPPG